MPPPDGIIAQVQASELALARQAVGRSEYTTAAGRLRGLVQATPANTPVGAEARTLYAQVTFELGDYATAASTAAQVPAGCPFSAAASEIEGTSRLFMCDFEGASNAFFRLAPMDDVRAGVWLGVAAAWTGAESNAVDSLQAVVTRSPGSSDAANARFYLAQLAFWGGRDVDAHRTLEELRTTPGYLDDLARRATNWLQRGVHLMRAYFTFDTLSRVSDAGFSAYSDRADAALRALRQAPAACSAQVDRLGTAHDTYYAGHRAEVARRAEAAAAAARAAAEADAARRAELERRIAAEAAARAAYERQTRDTDGDCIPDIRDRCPAEPETLNAFEDDDGCPEPTGAVEIVGGQIRIRAGFAVFFAPGESAVLPQSEPVLAGLAAILVSPAYEWIRRVRFEGHTDDVGDAGVNQRLSEQRVGAVGGALIARGVRANRLDRAAFGESRPVDRSGTEEARARNRRVEIIIAEPTMFGGVGRRCPVLPAR